MIEFHDVTRHVWLQGGGFRPEPQDPARGIVCLLRAQWSGQDHGHQDARRTAPPDVGKHHRLRRDTAAQTREATRFLGFVPDEAFLYDKLSGREFCSSWPRCAGSTAAKPGRGSPGRPICSS